MTDHGKYRVTIKDFTTWAISLEAEGSLEAESLDWDMFQQADQRELFEDDSDTTIQVEEGGA
jgi:hypothetical protein